MLAGGFCYLWTKQGKLYPHVSSLNAKLSKANWLLHVVLYLPAWYRSVDKKVCAFPKKLNSFDTFTHFLAFRILNKPAQTIDI